MRPTLGLLLGLLLAVPALAGPSVPRKMMQDVPEAAVAAGQALESEIARLDARSSEYARKAALDAGRVPTLKQEVKVVQAQIKAEKARRKAAKKAKDRSAVSTIEAQLKALDAKLTDAETLATLTALRADVLASHAALLAAEAEVKRCKVQQGYAEALNTVHPDFDPNKYTQATAKAETSYQKSRAKLATAEQKLVAGGGALEDLARDDRAE